MNTYSRHLADPSWVAACLVCYLYSGGSHAGAHSCPESEKGFCGAIANWSSISCPPGRKFLQGLAVGGWLCMHVNCCLWRWVVHSCPPGVCPTGVAWRGLKRVLSDVVNSFMGIWICNLYWAQSLFGLGVHVHESSHLSAVHAAATAVIAAMCTDSLGGSKLRQMQLQPCCYFALWPVLQNLLRFHGRGGAEMSWGRCNLVMVWRFCWKLSTKWQRSSHEHLL